MTFNQPYGYGQPTRGYYSGQDLREIAYRHLATALLISAFIIMAISVIFKGNYDSTALVSLYTFSSIAEIVILIGLVFISLFKSQLSESTATVILYAFAVVSSLSFAALIQFYMGIYANGSFLVTLTFGIAGVVTFGIYAYTSANKPDTTQLQKRMFVITIVFIVFVFIGFFVWSGFQIFYLILSGVGALIFAVYMYIDFARLESRQFSSPAMMALALFIDIIYFIQYLLQFLALFMGERR